MREAQADPRATPAEAALVACLATVLELPVEEVPEPEPGVDRPDGWRRWLAGRSVGLVPIAGAGDFSWPGPWIARIRPAPDELARAVVMYGVPSGGGTFPSGVSGSALTLIAAEVIDSFAPPLAADEHRRNVVTRGIDVNAQSGAPSRSGGRCQGARLCEPCTVLDRYSGRSLLRPLVHRGGLRADILTEGAITVGDRIEAHDPSAA
ncbi:MAG: MOSC domain-containing protein [Actinomycetota bacterium]|nr:MOSC domain-containing protein [Actinomycetota bacterium]